MCPDLFSGSESAMNCRPQDPQAWQQRHSSSHDAEICMLEVWVVRTGCAVIVLPQNSERRMKQ